MTVTRGAGWLAGDAVLGHTLHLLMSCWMVPSRCSWKSSSWAHGDRRVRSHMQHMAALMRDSCLLLIIITVSLCRAGYSLVFSLRGSGRKFQAQRCPGCHCP